MPIIVQAITSFSTNPGDSNAVKTVATKIPNAQVIERKMENADILTELLASINATDEYVLVLAGGKGIRFLDLALQQQKFRELIAQKRLVISWSGHQPPPDFERYIEHFNVVGLLIEFMQFNPALAARLGRRLIPLEFIPNSLTREILESGEELTKWNAAHPQAIIPDAPQGYIAVYLPGDAPDVDGTYKFYSAKDAYELGQCSGNEAKIAGKFLLATNGPRMGQFDPNSSNRQSPAPYEPTPHRQGAPMDPVSTAYLQGIIASGLPATQYRFIDFVYGDSAYQAIACAAYKYNANSRVYYSAESISQIEFGFFFQDAIAFTVNVMSALHKAFLTRVTAQLQRVDIAEVLPQGFLRTFRADPNSRQALMDHNPDSDGANMAKAIVTELELLRSVRHAGAGAPVLATASAPPSAPSAPAAPNVAAPRNSIRAAISSASRQAAKSRSCVIS